MQKFTTTVELPDPPKGYEIVAFRPPKKGEVFMSATGAIDVAKFDWECYIGLHRPILKKKRWRAVKGGVYFYITQSLSIDYGHDYRDEGANNLWEVGNYFRNKEEIEEVRSNLVQLLNKHHNG